MGRYATVVEVPSDSSAATYRVYVGEDGGTIFCDCPGFRLRPGQVEQRKPCKHMRRLGADEAVIEQARTIARTVGAQRRRTPAAVAAAATGGSSRFRFLEVMEENDGSWAPIAGARFNNLEVD